MGEDVIIPGESMAILDGPDKPALLWALAYPDRDQVQFTLESGPVAARILRIDERGEGPSFTVAGRLISGTCKDRYFRADYSVGSRSGTLVVDGRD